MATVAFWPRRCVCLAQLLLVSGFLGSGPCAFTHWCSFFAGWSRFAMGTRELSSTGLHRCVAVNDDLEVLRVLALLEVVQIASCSCRRRRICTAWWRLQSGGRLIDASVSSVISKKCLACRVSCSNRSRCSPCRPLRSQSVWVAKHEASGFSFKSSCVCISLSTLLAAPWLFFFPNRGPLLLSRTLP